MKFKNSKPYIKNLTFEGIENLVTTFGFEKYRAEQVYQYIYKSRKEDFSEFKTLPKSLRDKLSAHFELHSLKCKLIQTSQDKTQKFLFELHDGEHIETVLIKDETNLKPRYTLCVSTQVGCIYNCAFCATGKLGFKRNLEVAEIVDQILLVEKISKNKISNVVFMGMGEPLVNFKNLLFALEIMTHPKSKLIANYKITISTIGIPLYIKKLADTKFKVKLALSLHSAIQEKRRKIIPLAEKYSLKTLLEALQYYYNKTKIPITYEYILFDEFNDTDEDIEALVKLVKKVPSKVNLINYHNIEFKKLNGIASELKPTPKELVLQFYQKLKSKKINVFIRKSYGVDIDAGCGQLALSNRQSLFTPMEVKFSK